MPVLLESIWASKGLDKWIINWKLSTGFDISTMVLELAEEGQSFTTIASIQPLPGKRMYSCNVPARHTSALCRIKFSDLNNTVHYSQVLKLPGNTLPLHYPVRLIAGSSVLQIESKEAGRYLLEIVNSSGQVLLKYFINQPVGLASHSIPFTT